MSKKRVVLLVEHKNRDLNGCALIAQHLNDAGIETFLEPVNAWQSALGAHKPHFILFNHALRPHLADFTGRLHRLGVLTGVLPNEGLLYRDEVRVYNSKRLPNLHLDHYFCWNEPHRECLLKHDENKLTQVTTVGVPRFDFYFQPWNRFFKTETQARNRPRILVCTNFGFAEWRERPRSEVDQFFSQWSHLPSYANYWDAIEVNHRSRLRFFDFLKAILVSGQFEVVLKTHPRESRQLYESWLAALPEKLQTNINYVPVDANITPLILDCDLEISCEKCTTAMESWIARKPTIELVFEKHPLFYDHDFSKLNALCAAPEEIVATIETQLRQPEQIEFSEGRKKHLGRWCHSPAGNSSLSVATVIASSLKAHQAPKKLRLNLNDVRRGLKLKAYRAIGEPYTFSPSLQVREKLLGKKAYSKRAVLYEKSVTPKEVRQVMKKLHSLV